MSLSRHGAGATRRLVKMSAAFTLVLLVTACAQPRLGTASPGVAVTEVAAPVVAAANPAVGGATLSPLANLATNLAAAPTLQTLFRLAVGSERIGILAGPEAYTVFAPTEEAFGRLAPGTVEALVKPENRPALVKLVTLHVVAGRLSTAELGRRIATGGGRATLTSVAGEPLTLTMTGSIVTLTDGGGNRSYVEIADVRGQNGVMHVVNGVLVPRLPQ